MIMYPVAKYLKRPASLLLFNIPVFLFLLSLNNLSGQKDFKNGYIIGLENDTIYGQINLKSNYSNSLICEFKKNPDDIPVRYDPDQIKSYRIEDFKYYVAKDIYIDSVNKKVFLEYLLDGVVDLYFYKGKDHEYYYIDKEGEMYQLSNDEIVRNVNVMDDYYTRYAKNSNQYIGTLNYLFNDDPETKRHVPNTSYTLKSLINITKKYHVNTCPDLDCIDFTKSAKTKIVLEPNIGLVNSWMGLHTSPDHVYDISLSFGANIRIKPVMKHYLWNVIVGLNWAMNDFTGDFENTLFTSAQPRIKYNRIHARYHIIRIPIIVEYTFPFKKIQPLIELGFVNVLQLDPDYSVNIIDKYDFTDIVELGGIVDTEFRKHQFGFLSGAGLRYNLNELSYIQIKGDFEFRIPSQNLGHFLDYHHVKSLIFYIGYGISLP